MTWDEAFATLAEAYDNRFSAGLETTGNRVGCIGSDIPFELIEACGWRPFRIAPIPGLPTPDGDRFVGGGGDGDVRTLFQMLIDGAFGPLDRLIIAHDYEALPRLHYALREFRRRWPDRAQAMPDPEFFDLLHLPRKTTTVYNRRRLAALREALGGCSDDELHAAIAARNAVRARLLALRHHRADRRVSGCEALPALASAYLLPPHILLPLLDALLSAAAERAQLPLPGVFITGSPHDHPLAYGIIEESGLLIVGEDHDWGDRGNEAMTRENGDPLDALVDRYQSGTPAAAKFTIADRAAYLAMRVSESRAEQVICYVRKGDPAPRWDVPDQRAAVHPVPFRLLDDQPWVPDRAALTASLNKDIAGAAA